MPLKKRDPFPPIQIGAKSVSLLISFVKAMTPPAVLKVWEWADKHRILPETSSHESGQWRTDRFPFLKRIMELLSPDCDVRQIVVMKGSQLGFTEVFLNWAFYIIEFALGPMLYVQKTLDVMEVFVKQRFDTSVDSMKSIKSKIGKGTIGRSTGDTGKLKIFPGGMLRFGGANSAASLRSMPIKFLCLDEEDSFENDIQDEGSPSQLAIRRTANFPNRKIYRLSSPATKETSVIEPLFEAGTRERYHVPCPHCGHFDWIRWKNIRYENNDPETAMLLCEDCGSLIPEHYKTEMLNGGKWVPENPGADYPSFHISALYSPYGFYSWKDAVREWIAAKNKSDNSDLKVFINTVLAETWSESNQTVKASALEEKKEKYTAEVPEPVIVLTAGTDVQADRIECEVVGWGPGQESWSIDYKIFRGDTEKNAVWKMFDSYLGRQFTHAKGNTIGITCAGIDSGYRTKIVYEFCRMREHRYIYPIKGNDGWGKGYINRPTKKNKFGVYGFTSYVDEIKSRVYSHLQITDPGPGFCHFPDKDNYDLNYFKMLTAENLEKIYMKGKYKLIWRLPKGRRNEALDCRVSNIAILSIVIPDFDSLPVNKPLNLNQGKAPRRRRRSSRGVN